MLLPEGDYAVTPRVTDEWWYEPMLSLAKNLREVVEEWGREGRFDETLAEEYGSQVEQMFDAAREWLRTAPEGETRHRVVEAMAAVSPEHLAYFGVPTA